MTVESDRFGKEPAGEIVGILLAAGRGTRFDATGAANKLLQPLRGGGAVARTAAGHLKAAVGTVIAVIRPGAAEVRAHLEELGCTVVECVEAEQGMAHSLTHALSRAGDASGWIIALADMPYVRPATMALLADAIRDGAGIAVPTYGGQRGNPVAFSRTHLPALLGLTGDRGARGLLASLPVTEIPTDDPGIRLDIDTPDDLSR